MRKTNILTAIAGRIWALWGLCLFIITMVIAMLFYAFCYLMKEPLSARWHRQVSRVWMGFYLFCIGCPLKVTGKENFRRGKNYIVVCNHSSFMDVPVTTPFMPHANKTIAKKEFAAIPFFGWIYSLGAILVDRKSEQSRKQSYAKMKAVLRIGLDMVIYPEGTRNRSNEPLKPFHDGAFRLSAETGVPIIPTLIFNTKKILPPDKPFFLLPHVIRMHFLPPQLPDGLPVPVLKQKVFELMKEYYVANKAD
ncbi:1-acyl-sn-glycerol-3-phosphate acyltransferase [Ilyomonas limi]|uniref:1-acyl-sn-glycerol-3-phosphate acyltransferase n=1 Tax=Ilyomonas limi TaxID=2575867 RepID=A0A4U3L4L9_9BACT|nr:lysophospholipid acyltransferase family protein [Ilyomonas limi]TKK68507.1 1-acyl-sn-glycerol-3-phosphate acyltransferase [Ilyomonas limi]